MTMKSNTLLNNVKKRIIPALSDKQDMKDFTAELISACSKTYKPIICGSVGKDTWLSHRREADMFMIFSPNITKKQLEIRGLSAGKKITKKLGGKWKLAYSEHPYLQALFKFRGKEYEVDLVPAFGISNPSKIKSAVDRTPHHMKFILKNLQAVDDVRLLKQFCIGQECYGADLKVLGFSGYLCELLIVKYGSFIKLVRAASKWKPGKTILVTNRKPTRKFDTSLIVIDPVDPARNVAAVVSPEKFFKFVKACQSFLKTPKITHFFPAPVQPLTISELKTKLTKRGTSLLIIKFSKSKVLDDILWAQMRKSLRILEKRITDAGFEVLETGSWMDNKNIVLLFEMEDTKVSKVKKKIGPYVKSKSAHYFLEHYKDTAFVQGKRWVVEVPREFTSLEKFITHYTHITPKKLRLRGIPSKLLSMNKSKIEIIPTKTTVTKTLPKDFFQYLRKWFKK